MSFLKIWWLSFSLYLKIVFIFCLLLFVFPINYTFNFQGKELLEKQMKQEDISCLPTLKISDISSKIIAEPFEIIQSGNRPQQYWMSVFGI